MSERCLTEECPHLFRKNGMLCCRLVNICRNSPSFDSCYHYQTARAEAAEKQVVGLDVLLQGYATELDAVHERLRRAEEVVDATEQFDLTYVKSKARAYRRDYPAEAGEEKEGEG